MKQLFIVVSEQKKTLEKASHLSLQIYDNSDIFRPLSLLKKDNIEP